MYFRKIYSPKISAAMSSRQSLIAVITLLLLVPSLGACVEQQLNNSQGELQASSPASSQVAQLSTSQQGTIAPPVTNPAAPPPLENESPEIDRKQPPLPRRLIRMCRG